MNAPDDMQNKLNALWLDQANIPPTEAVFGGTPNVRQVVTVMLSGEHPPHVSYVREWQALYDRWTPWMP